MAPRGGVILCLLRMGSFVIQGEMVFLELSMVGFRCSLCYLPFAMKCNYLESVTDCQVSRS